MQQIQTGPTGKHVAFLFETIKQDPLPSSFDGVAREQCFLKPQRKEAQGHVVGPHWPIEQDVGAFFQGAPAYIRLGQVTNFA